MQQNTFSLCVKSNSMMWIGIGRTRKYKIISRCWNSGCGKRKILMNLPMVTVTVKMVFSDTLYFYMEVWFLSHKAAHVQEFSVEMENYRCIFKNEAFRCKFAEILHLQKLLMNVDWITITLDYILPCWWIHLSHGLFQCSKLGLFWLLLNRLRDIKPKNWGISWN